MTATPKKRVGRPAKPASERADTFSIRLTPDLRAKVEAAAAESGRSLTAEIVWRLESTFSSSLTYTLIDRRLEEFEQLRAREAEWRLNKRLLTNELEALPRTDENASKRSQLERHIRIAGEERALAQSQLKRIEREIELLVEDLGKRVGNALEADKP